MAMERVIPVLLVASTLISLAFAKHGTATFYTSYVPSACYGNQDDGVMVAAANPSLFHNNKVCGQRFKIRCRGGTNGTPKPCRKGKVVTVKIVDLCPTCATNQLDLSREAFAKIANPDAGKVRISFIRV